MPTNLLPIKTTQLTPELEKLYKGWVIQNNIPESKDYDMRGFFLGGLLKDPAAQSSVNQSDMQLHFSDKWKLPNHPLFSNESMYSRSSTDPKWIGNYVDDQGKQQWNLSPYIMDTWARVSPRKGLLDLELPFGY